MDHKAILDRIAAEPDNLAHRLELFESLVRIAYKRAVRYRRTLGDDASQEAALAAWETCRSWQPGSRWDAKSLVSNAAAWSLRKLAWRTRSAFSSSETRYCFLDKLAAAERAFRNEHGRSPTREEMAEALGVKLSSVEGWKEGQRLRVVTTTRDEYDPHADADEVDLVSREPSALSITIRNDLLHRATQAANRMPPLRRFSLLAWIAGRTTREAARSRGVCERAEAALRSLALQSLREALASERVSAGARSRASRTRPGRRSQHATN